MNLDPQLPIKVELTLEEVNGICVALGELPTKTNAFMLIAKINGQVQSQLPKEEVLAEEPKTE
jgi:hypothetical protein